MGAITGVSGDITIPGGEGGEAGITVTRWSADLQRDIHETSAFGTVTNGKTITGGLAHMTGTIEGFMTGTTQTLGTMAGINQAPTGGFTLESVQTTNKYTFPGIMSNIRMDVPKVGMTSISLSFESSGVVVRTTPA